MKFITLSLGIVGREIELPPIPPPNEPPEELPPPPLPPPPPEEPPPPPPDEPPELPLVVPEGEPSRLISLLAASVSLKAELKQQFCCQ